MLNTDQVFAHQSIHAVNPEGVTMSLKLNEVQYSIRQPQADNRAYFTIGVSRRLQSCGKDYYAYANTRFVTEDETATELLTALLIAFRRDDSGVEQVHVKPFTLGIIAPALSKQNVREMFETSARIAGLKPIVLS